MAKDKNTSEKDHSKATDKNSKQTGFKDIKGTFDRGELSNSNKGTTGKTGFRGADKGK